MIRLDKFLVSVNGAVCKKSEEKIDPACDVVTVAGNEVVYEAFSYYLFYKPAGCVTAKSDTLHKTVMDYFPEIVRKSCSPVGRLDKDTEGVLLITDDGGLNHHLMSPAHHVKKTYYAVLDREVPVSAIQQFAEGVDIVDEKKTLPAELEILPKQMQDTEAPVYHANLTISEGRFHQVKRMFETVGCHVVYLKRLSLGNLSLGELNPGEYRRLSEAEVTDLRK